MSKAKNAVREAKKAAYARKTEKKEQNVIKWIFGVLIALGVVYAVYSVIVQG